MQEEKTEENKIENQEQVMIKKNKLRKKILIITAVIVLIGLLTAFLLWLFLIKEQSFTGENVYFDISGPSELTAGETATFEIKYTNNENIDLENLEISIIYPDGFIFKSSDPKSKSFNDNKWEFDLLRAGESESVIIKGDIYGEVGASLVTAANLIYKPRNVSSNFNQTVDLSTKINPVDIDLEINIADTVQNDKDFEYIIKAKNNTDFDVNNIRIEALLPNNFELITAAPNYKSSYYWDFPKIVSGKSEEVKITGKISSQTGDELEFKARYGLFDAHNKFYLQGEEIKKVKTVDISGDLKLLVNGVEETSKNPGDMLEYTLFYKNTGSETLKNNILTLELDHIDLLDTGSIVTDQGDLIENKAVWSFEKIEKLKSIEPGQEGAFVFKIKIIDPIIVDNIEDANFNIKAKPLHVAKRGTGDEEVVIEGNEISTKINTQITLAAEARYYDFQGKQIGSGPLPPKVGEKTTYRIYITLANRTNDVENGRVEIILGELAKWENKISVSVGDLKFEGGKVIWEIGNIPANTGQFANHMQAEFDLFITPRAEDVGKTPDLLKEIKFIGMDSYTNNKIEFTEAGLNTSLTKDFLAEGKDEVSN